MFRYKFSRRFFWALAGALLLPGLAQAASTFNLSTATGGGTAAEYSWDAGTKTLTLNDGADMTVTGSASDGTHIVVADNATATLTLANASITHPGDGISPLAVGSGAGLILKLTGANTLTAGTCAAGIEAPDIMNYLDIHGLGSLTATGGNEDQGAGCTAGAGIGGNGGESSGGIYIYSGTVTAQGGKADSAHGGTGGAAGIGGGGGGNAYGIWVGNESGGGSSDPSAGATVTAIGGEGAAGIGGGAGGSNGNSDGGINITAGARVTATGGAAPAGSNMGGGAGIGSGGTDAAAPLASGYLSIGHYATVTATGGKGDGTGGNGANIGQGGYAGSNGAGLTSFAGPSNKSVAEGGNATFTCTPTFPTGPAASSLDWTWFQQISPGDVTNLGVGNASLTLNGVSKATMDGTQYFCMLDITNLANDPAGADSEIYYSSHLATLTVTSGGGAAATAVPTLSEWALALLALMVAGVAWRRRGMNSKFIA